MKIHFYINCHGRPNATPMRWRDCTCLHCLKTYVKILRNLPKTAGRPRNPLEEIELIEVSKRYAFLVR